MKQKMYVIKKYIPARSAQEAINKEKKVAVDDVFVDAEWAGGRSPLLSDAVGFTTHAKKRRTKKSAGGEDMPLLS